MSNPTTIRLLSGPVVREEDRGATARRTGEPSAATRALRFLGTGFEVSEVDREVVECVELGAIHQG
jgi:hypothetical protein